MAAPGGGYQTLASTDMSAALTAGVAALIRGRYPWLTAAEVTQAIEGGATAPQRRPPRVRPAADRGRVGPRRAQRRGALARAAAIAAAHPRPRATHTAPATPPASRAAAPIAPSRRRANRATPAARLRSVLLDLLIAACVLIAGLICALAVTWLRRRARSAGPTRPASAGSAPAAAPATPGAPAAAARLPRRRLAGPARRPPASPAAPGERQPVPPPAAIRRDGPLPPWEQSPQRAPPDPQGRRLAAVEQRPDVRLEPSRRPAARRRLRPPRQPADLAASRSSRPDVRLPNPPPSSNRRTVARLERRITHRGGDGIHVTHCSTRRGARRVRPSATHVEVAGRLALASRSLTSEAYSWTYSWPESSAIARITSSAMMRRARAGGSPAR